MQNVEQFSRELFKIAKWARNASADTLIQTTIFFLIKSECFNIAMTAQNKMKMMFQTYFSSSSEILMLNTEDFKYSFSIENDALLMHRKIKKIVYKTMLNKTSRHTEYIYKIMCRFVDDTSEQIHSLFERCLQKKIQSTQFKNAITIMM